MNHPINQFEKRAKNIRLTLAERSAMRGRLAVFMAAHPLPQAVPSPYLSFLSLLTRPAFLSALLIFAIAGTSTAFAAEGALPGDTLYGVKVNVVEPVRGVLAVTSIGKAEWNVHLTDERLIEAQKLASTNRLSKDAQRSLGKRLAIAATLAAHQVNDLASSSPKSAVAVAVTLDSTLSAHQAAISALANDDTAGDSAPVLAALAGQVDDTVSNTAETLASEMAVSVAATSNPEVTENVARIQLFAADESNKAAKGALRIAAPMLEATTTAAASTSLRASDDTIKKGKREFNHKAFTDAAKLFARARALAHESENIIRATSTEDHETDSHEDESN